MGDNRRCDYLILGASPAGFQLASSVVCSHCRNLVSTAEGKVGEDLGIFG